MTSRNRYSLFFALFLICAPTLSFAQSAREAFNALKDLEIKVKYGTAYSDFAPALSEARFPVRSFLDSPDARNNPEFAAALVSTLQHYDAAHDVWSEKYADHEVTDFITDKYLGSSYYRCVHEYRAASVSSKNLFTGEMKYTVGITDCLARIWEKASETLVLTATILSRIEKKAVPADAARIEPDAPANLDQKRTEAIRLELETANQEMAKIKSDHEELKKENINLQLVIDKLKIENATLLAKVAAPQKDQKKKKKKKISHQALK
ncbi:MAG: hypothetical protein C0402_16405 [Thermodesulfovibrio sp.]|nr:hypothetical protein [Thermodesulfovibrio sp.]